MLTWKRLILSYDQKYNSDFKLLSTSTWSNSTEVRRPLVLLHHATQEVTRMLEKNFELLIEKSSYHYPNLMNPCPWRGRVSSDSVCSLLLVTMSSPPCDPVAFFLLAALTSRATWVFFLSPKSSLLAPLVLLLPLSFLRSQLLVFHKKSVALLEHLSNHVTTITSLDLFIGHFFVQLLKRPGSEWQPHCEFVQW